MKLDDQLIDELIEKIYDYNLEDISDYEKMFSDLDLVFKSGDSSQSILTTNKSKEKTWPEVYDKRK